MAYEGPQSTGTRPWQSSASVHRELCNGKLSRHGRLLPFVTSSLSVFADKNKPQYRVKNRIKNLIEVIRRAHDAMAITVYSQEDPTGARRAHGVWSQWRVYRARRDQ